jgi:type II secretory pathway pseudopilin PulG
LVELLVVVGIIAVLVGLFTVAMLSGHSTELMLKSHNHLRQIAQWMDQYSTNHRDTVVPSRFDYLDENGTDPQKVGGARFYHMKPDGEEWLTSANPFRDTGDPREDGIAQGSWADILWKDANLGSTVNVEVLPVYGTSSTDVFGADGRSSAAAPGWWLYRDDLNEFANPLRSAAPNTYHYPKFDSSGAQLLPVWGERGQVAYSPDPEGRMQGLPTPLGAGAWEKDLPGFFAANNFFDARSRADITGNSSDPIADRFVTNGQVRAPARSLYLIDSFRGEVIGGGPQEDPSVYEQKTRDAYTNTIRDYYGDHGTTSDTQEVDFRYSGGDMTLMLFLDGHIANETTWRSYDQLVGTVGQFGGAPGRGVRIMDLDRRLRRPTP